MEPERSRYPHMGEVVFRLEAEGPGHLEAQAVGAAFSAGVTLPSRVTAPTLEELLHEARGAWARLIRSPASTFQIAPLPSTSPWPPP